MGGLGRRGLGRRREAPSRGLHARAYVIVDPSTEERVAFAARHGVARCGLGLHHARVRMDGMDGFV